MTLLNVVFFDHEFNILIFLKCYSKNLKLKQGDFWKFLQKINFLSNIDKWAFFVNFLGLNPVILMCWSIRIMSEIRRIATEWLQFSSTTMLLCRFVLVVYNIYYNVTNRPVVFWWTLFHSDYHDISTLSGLHLFALLKLLLCFPLLFSFAISN